MNMNLVWMAFLTLAQVLLIALKIIEAQNRKRIMKNNPGNDPPCKEHGEKISSLVTDMGNVKERLGRIENKLNGMR
jgi:hypothetical protein